MISFTTKVKDEVSKIETNKLESISELLSYLIFNSDFINNRIVVSVENNSVARRVFSLIKRIYGINVKLTVRLQKKFKIKTFYILEIIEKTDIIKADMDEIIKHIKEYSEEEKYGFLKGVFMACGSVNDPSTSKYHLEFIIKDEQLSYLVTNLLISLGLNGKVIKREKGYMVYLKSSEEISDFIKMLGANNSLFYYEDIRIYRDHKNMVNRLNNCEQANVEKSLKTCNEQLKNIEYLEESDLIDLLDEKTRLVIEYRKKYPESTMSELADIISLETDMSITKSGINHHFRKINELVHVSKSKVDIN